MWQPFDDGSQNKLALLQSTISLLEIEIENLNGQDYVIMGDFNADFNRSNRFDLLFKQLLIKLNMFDLAYSYECDLTPTYAKGTYSSTLDHIWVSDHMIHKIIDFKIVSHPADASDHRPISCQIRSVSTNIDLENVTIAIKRRHRFPWQFDFFREEYANDLDQKIQSLSEECHNLPTCSYIQNIHTKLPRLKLQGMLRGS